MNHEKYMRQAIDVARRNPQAPFGTVLVDVQQDRPVVTGLNQSAVNPILHGEIDAINQYARQKQDRWGQLRLYTTAEPCCMCQAAIIWAGIPEVVFGTSIETLIGLGWKQVELKAVDVAQAAAFGHCELIGGVLAAECDQLFKSATKGRAFTV